MQIPIKNIILEFFGPGFTAVKQNHDSKLTPKHNLPRSNGPVIGNGSAMDAQNKALKPYQPQRNIVADNQRAESAATARVQAQQDAKNQNNQQG